MTRMDARNHDHGPLTTSPLLHSREATKTGKGVRASMTDPKLPTFLPIDVMAGMAQCSSLGVAETLAALLDSIDR